MHGTDGGESDGEHKCEGDCIKQRLHQCCDALHGLMHMNMLSYVKGDDRSLSKWLP